MAGILHPQGARYNSLQNFTSFFKVKENHPSTTNLYSVHFWSPICMTRQYGGLTSDTLDPSRNRDLNVLLDYYAKNVNLPSKQITTGQVVNVGSPIKYATGSAHSQINITFQMPRSQLTRNFFERWMMKMSQDSNQYTDYFKKYVSPKIMIYKWERGGGDLAITDPVLLAQLRNSQMNPLMARKNELTACWEVQNAFPYNIGSVQLNNDSARVMDLTIGFYYERYRFYTQDKFDDDGKTQQVSRRLTRNNNIQPDRETYRDSANKNQEWNTNQKGAWG
tara:strand:+ start:99 stop:932 length:834 start_codon:yes stop_codon:yes gene_type:complete